MSVSTREASISRPATVATRDSSLDIIRLVAIFLVITIHISGRGFPAFNENWAAVNFYESISRVSVPLFFMVTGALLLQKEMSIESIIRRIWRVTFPLVAWSLIYLSYYAAIGVKKENWFYLILTNDVAGHFWYLYTLIGLYMFLPVLIGFQKIKTDTQGFALACWFVGGSIAPTYYYLTKKSFSSVDWSFFYIYGFYVALGAFVYWKLATATITAMVSGALFIVATAATGLLTWYLTMSSGAATTVFYDYWSPFVVLGAAACFVLLRHISAGMGPRLVEAVRELNALSFGVYLIHPLVIWTLENKGLGFNAFNPWLWIPILTLLVFLISSAAIYVLRLTPLIRAFVPN